MTNAVLGLRIKQQLTLTPRLQQSVKLLQLSALECVQELHQSLAQNPFLEEVMEAPDSRGQNEESADSTTSGELDFSGSGSGASPSAGRVTETAMVSVAPYECAEVESRPVLRQSWACSGFPASARWASPSASFWVGWA